MKEVTYEEWQKNPTPRMMWVWDDETDNKIKKKVIYILDNIDDKDIDFPVVTLSYDENAILSYRHCAEIGKQRRMTNKELSRWLRENPTRECKSLNDSSDSFVFSFHTYLEKCANEEVDDLILIREDDGEWHEPLVEVAE